MTPSPRVTPSPDSAPIGSFMSGILASARAHAPAPDVNIGCDIAPRDLPSGHVLRGYRLLHTLGAGGFGVTYLAEEALLQRRVVIKEHFPDALCFRESGTLNVRLHEPGLRDTFRWALHNFLREVRLLASIHHPRIARVYSYFEAHGTAYYVTEYIDGPSFAEVVQRVISRGELLPQRALFGLLVRVLDALDYLHDRSLLHCDLKPDNILLTRQGMPVLIDFGAAQEKQETSSARVVESVGFSPSEQHSGGEQMGPWTDLYALGATLYYALTGECLPGCRQRELYDTVQPLAERPELREHYHPRFLASVDRAIRPIIRQRYQCVAEWMDDLRSEERIPRQA